MRGPKWLTGITVGRSAPGGYWEQQGWDPSAPVQTMSRFDAPLDGAVLPIGAVLVGGIAFAADRGIQSVEWSTDGGTTWRPATLEAPLSPLTWVRWQATWHPPRAGSYRLAVRARDGKGTLQTSAVANSFPSGATGLHEIDISIGSKHLRVTLTPSWRGADCRQAAPTSRRETSTCRHSAPFCPFLPVPGPQSQTSEAPCWYSVTRVSKKFFSLLRSVDCDIQGNGFLGAVLARQREALQAAVRDVLDVLAEQ